MSLKDHALALAQKGFRVFPLIPNGKTPAVKGWQKKATVDSPQIRQWWDKCPQYNVGIATGCGLVVIDYDVKQGKRGDEALFIHEELLGLPATMRVRTATGGLHIYLKVGFPIGNSVSKIEDSVDIRGDGGYVVGPGSVIEGRVYELVA